MISNQTVSSPISNSSSQQNVFFGHSMELQDNIKRRYNNYPAILDILNHSNSSSCSSPPLSYQKPNPNHETTITKIQSNFTHTFNPLLNQNLLEKEQCYNFNHSSNKENLPLLHPQPSFQQSSAPISNYSKILNPILDIKNEANNTLPSIHSVYSKLNKPGNSEKAIIPEDLLDCYTTLFYYQRLYVGSEEDFEVAMLYYILDNHDFNTNIEEVQIAVDKILSMFENNYALNAKDLNLCKEKANIWSKYNLIITWDEFFEKLGKIKHIKPLNSNGISISEEV